VDEGKEETLMKDPVDHILRPRLPWRSEAEDAITECGLNAAKVSSLTREAFFQRLKDYGQQRTAMTTCMTCSNTASRWRTWSDDPRQALAREIDWEGGRWGERRGHRLLDELLAIEQLIASHRDEFDAILKEASERRTWNERKAAMQARGPNRNPREGF
jgi:hypothetical protein